MHFIIGISFRNWIIVIVGMSMAAVALMLAFETTAERRFQAVNESWKISSEEAAVVTDALNDLRAAIGYGGLIHNFKNYVLRRDTKYLADMDGNIQDGDKAIAILELNLTRPNEILALRDIQDTLNEYIEKRNMAVLHWSDLTPANLDKLARVDDAKALQAMNFLLGEVQARRLAHEQATDRAMADASAFLRLGYFVIALVVVLSGLMIFLILNLEKAWSAAEIANRAKSSFLSSMSHELRTPLNAVMGFTQLVKFNLEDRADDQNKAYLDHIEGAGKQLVDLIDQVLDLSKIEAEGLMVSAVSVPVGGLLEEATEIMTPEAKKAGVAMQVDLKTNGCVMADEPHLRRVVLNLLSNAIKYNREAGSVTLSADEVRKGAIRIEVADTGRGIPTELQGRVFNAFDRLGQESGVVAGTGIGLNIVKRAVEAMNGQIGFESVPGQGSTFWVELPSCPMAPASA